MSFDEAMLIPAIWQLVLAGAGLCVTIAQHRALLRTPPATTLPPWGAKTGGILAFCGISVLCFVGIPLLCGQLAPQIFPQTNFRENFLPIIPVMQTLALICLLGFVKIFPEAFPPQFNAPEEHRAKDWLSPKNAFGVPAFFALGIFVVVASSLLVQGLVSFFPEEIRALFQENQMLVKALNASENKVVALLCVPAIAIFTPIIEELIFRAGIYRFFKSKISALPAAILSSAIFALMHDSYASYLPLTLFGCLLCLAYEKTGRIAAPILIHGLFNANTLLCLALANI